VLAETLELAVDMAPDRIALFGYAHVPHMIPRQQKIDAAHLPDQRDRFRMAAEGRAYLTGKGYQSVGFDHFALPGDDLARVTREGRLRRNFQGFTDDQSPALIGLGASSISEFPGAFIQNEKNAGRYRMLVASGTMPGRRGVERTAEDRRRGAVIEALLCRGTVRLDDDLLAFARPRLAPFIERGLATVDGAALSLLPVSEPYHRTVAAIFDAYRSAEKKFSSAV
jgi:oxygen-independent coproporphyrinogen-3 oxidase